MLESIGSARIEGNRTTVAEYIEQKIEDTESPSENHSENYSEIANVQAAMEYIEKEISEGTDITHRFIRELHQLVVGGLVKEGDKTPGAYRTWNVDILQSLHNPPDSVLVQDHMDDLVAFINKNDHEKYDLLKTAIAHHRFAWVHPFGNGNGRVVRLLTYAMMIKFGFNVKHGQILNPTAVFCMDRDMYYQKLSEADSGTDEALLNWCQYVLEGILAEVTKINKLLDFSYLKTKILHPTIERSLARKYLTKSEARILAAGINHQEFNSSDLSSTLSGLSSRQRTHQISKMKKANFIQPTKKGGQTYYVNFVNNYLMRSLIQILSEESFIPPIGS
jgi:Fic family protein